MNENPGPITEIVHRNVPTNRVPIPVRHVAAGIAAFIHVPIRDLFVADHTHEEVPEGDWTIAYEGAYDWPHAYLQKQQAPAGWGFEALEGWCLLIYPTKD